MPVYEYECKTCHREFEYQQRMADPDKTVCEVCGGPLERLISRTAFQLKGSGWYKDLYSSSKPETKSSDSSSSDTKSDSSSGDAKSSDAKPSDAKSESKPAESKAEAKPAAAKSESKPSGSSGTGGSGTSSSS